MAFLMIVTMMPLNVFAETYKEKGFSEEKTTDWTSKKDREIARYWPIPNQGRIVKVSTGEPIKNPSLRYIGGYTRPDGREVIRLAFSAYSGSTSAVWERLILKPDHNLNELIDWKESCMARKRPEQFTNNHDGYNFNKDWVKFEGISATQGGSGDLHVMDLGEKGTNTVKVGTLGSHYEVPIDLVIKEDKTVKNLDKNPLIQMRLTDAKYEGIYSTTISTNQAIPYSSYTMSTFVPARVDLKQGILNTDVVRNHENLWQSASSYIKYNEEKGYFDVYMRRTHGTVGSRASDGDSGVNSGDYGFMQSFDESLIDILKPQDVSKTVIQLFSADDNDNIYNPSDDDPSVPKAANRVDYSINAIKRVNGVGIVMYSSNTPGDTFLPTGTTLTTYGRSTVVRYYIDKAKLKEKFGSTDLISYEFFSTLFATNPEGVEEFKSVTRDADIDLKRGDTIDILFDGRRDLVSAGNFDKNGSFIQIGDDQYKISIRTTADKSTYTGGGIVWDANYMRKMTVWVPFDIKIKKDTPLTIFSRKTRNMEVSPGMTVTFNYSAKDISGKTIKKDKTYRFERPLKDGYTRNEKGEIFKDGKKINKPTQALFIDNHEPLMTSRQENFGGGILASTVELPDVDEVFTDSKYISGRTKYESAKIYLYGRGETNDKPKKLATMTASDKKVDVVVNRKETEGYEWSSAKNDSSAKVDTKIWTYKDTPLFFTNQDVLQNALENKTPVVEQVQAKVHFDLSGQQSKIDGRGIIDKIAPLNKEYLYKMVEEQDPKDKTKTIKKIVKNEEYKASGFAKLDKDDNVTGVENLKVDTKIKIVTVKQKLTDSQQQTTTIDRKVINYIDHDGRLYDITAKDQKIKDDQINKLLLRQFPVNEEVNLPNAKKIIGWTTVKLEDKKDSNGKVIKTAEEQYYELLNSTNASGANDKVIRKLEDWKKVDDDEEAFKANPNAPRDIYVFDEASPIDKERTVYAVYGGLSIVLHSGKEDASGNEITVRIPVTQEDLDYTDQTLLDATTSSTLYNLAGKIVMKRMPKAPYTSEAKDVNAADEKLKEFKKDNNSFVGWTILSDQSNLRVGNNNTRISALLKGEITLEDGSKTAIPKESESLKNLIKDKLSAVNEVATLPNGFTFAFSPDNFDKDANFTAKKADGLDTRQKLLDTVSEIHLYAVYRPYFNVTVHPQYKKVDKTNGTYGEYVDGVASGKQKSLQIGLLTRTAVTGYGKPTVDASANYEPIGEASSVLKTWDPNAATPTDLTWNVPGFDTLGRRKSYVSVVVPQGKENEYTKFADSFTDQSWSKLGISTYTKDKGASKDPNAPKNLYKDTDVTRDPYGVALAKTQAFTLTHQETVAGATKDVTDAFTSATARKPLLTADKEEVTGYDIVMTNALESLPTPKFDKVKDTDKKVLLEWKKGTQADPTDYDKINKIEFYLNGNTYTFTKDQDGKFISGTKTATINATGDKIEVTGITLEGMGGKDLQAKYFATVAGNETSGEIGSTRIISDKTSAPVTKMEQGVKNKPTDKPTIKFTVPEKTLDQVGTGSKYIAEKWVPDSIDPSQGRWVKVGEKILKDADKKNGKYQGNEYDMELPGPVADNDKVRIVSYESNPDAEYTPEEKQADPSLENGFSKPAYSTRKTIKVPDPNDPNDPNKTITKDISAVTEAPVDGEEGTQYVTLDLKAPTATATATEDEAFRRFIDIKGQLDEIPSGQKVTLEFGDTQGATGNKTITFETKEKAISYINQIPRDENMPKMWIIAKDIMGNQSTTELKYQQTYQCSVEVTNPRAGRPFIAVKSDMDGVEIVIEVYHDGTKVAEGRATTTAADTIARLDFKKIEDGNVTTDAYRLQAGDVLEIKGSVNKEGKLYTTNPLSIEVED